MKTCSFCAKEVFDEAKKCPFCDTPFGEKKVKWYFKTSSLIVGFLMVGPFVLPAVWFNPHYSQQKKIIITAVILLITFLLTLATVKAISSIGQYYGQILNLQNPNQ